MNLSQIRHVAQNVWNGSQLVAIQIDICQTGPVYILLLKIILIIEVSKVIL